MRTFTFAQSPFPGSSHPLSGSVLTALSVSSLDTPFSSGPTFLPSSYLSYTPAAALHTSRIRSAHYGLAFPRAPLQGLCAAFPSQLRTQQNTLMGPFIFHIPSTFLILECEESLSSFLFFIVKAVPQI